MAVAFKQIHTSGPSNGSPAQLSSASSLGARVSGQPTNINTHIHKHTKTHLWPQQWQPCPAQQRLIVRGQAERAAVRAQQRGALRTKSQWQAGAGCQRAIVGAQQHLRSGLGRKAERVGNGNNTRGG